MIKGKNIFLRALEPSDLENLYRWENDPEVWEVSGTLEPWSRHVLEEYIHNSHNDIYTSKQLRLVICKLVDNMPAGCIDLFDFDPLHLRAGLGIMVAKEERGKGLAGEALEVLSNYAFSVMNLHQLYANVGINNLPSLKLFESKGFIRAGLKKDWVRSAKGFEDEVLFQLIKS